MNKDKKDLYPWNGEFKEGNPQSSVAVVTLADKINFDPQNPALWGRMKTENLGIEKVIANVISNPNIRYLIVCGEEITGHKSGKTLISLVENGINEDGHIIEAPGAVPYIENLSSKAIERFRNQIEILNHIGVTDKNKLEDIIKSIKEENTEPYGEPYIAIKIEKEKESKLEADYALHANLNVTPWGEISSMEET